MGKKSNFALKGAGSTLCVFFLEGFRASANFDACFQVLLFIPILVDGKARYPLDPLISGYRTYYGPVDTHKWDCNWSPLYWSIGRSSVARTQSTNTYM